MALQARADFHEIDFSKSVMVGDGLHDMEFGRRLGMQRVFISDAHKSDYKDVCDFIFPSLKAFSEEIIKK